MSFGGNDQTIAKTYGTDGKDVASSWNWNATADPTDHADTIFGFSGNDVLGDDGGDDGDSLDGGASIDTLRGGIGRQRLQEATIRPVGIHTPDLGWFMPRDTYPARQHSARGGLFRQRF